MSARAPLVSSDPSAADQTPDRGAGVHAQRLVALVKQILEKNGIGGPVPVTEQLSALGLSSLDMVNLMIAVEVAFDLAIPAAEITPANFRSIATIEALLVRLGARAAGPTAP
jgi:acyl carrier protein